MKKVTAAIALSSFLFFSCLTSTFDTASDPNDFDSLTVTEDAESDAKSAQEETSENSSSAPEGTEATNTDTTQNTAETEASAETAEETSANTDAVEYISETETAAEQTETLPDQNETAASQEEKITDPEILNPEEVYITEKVPEQILEEDEKLLSALPENQTKKQDEQVTVNLPETEVPVQAEKTAQTIPAEPVKTTQVAVKDNSTKTQTVVTEKKPQPETTAKPEVKNEVQKPQVSKPQIPVQNVKIPQPKTVQPAKEDTKPGDKSIEIKPEEKTVYQEIDEYNKDQIENPQEEKPVQADPVPSRTTTVKNNQAFDITYPGTGWIYLGEHDHDNKFIFSGRKIADGQTTFSLKAKKSGKALLHFYKNDPLTGKYIDDYIEVEISKDFNTSSQRAAAPDYASVVPSKPKKEIPAETESNADTKVTAAKEPEKKTDSKIEYKEEKTEPVIDTGITTNIKSTDSKETENTVNTITVTETGTASAQKVQPEEEKPQGTLLDQAKKAYNDKDFPKALTLVRQYLDSATNLIDEAIYLEGQILEAKSSVRNIKDSLKCYETIIENWVQSSRWEDAKKRSTYLRRFYIDIR
ncbi:MAG: hypothetical protein MJ169_06690 [Treponema sp.]|nr:hypothetical protein [Treponema sp.]